MKKYVPVAMLMLGIMTVTAAIGFSLFSSSNPTAPSINKYCPEKYQNFNFAAAEYFPGDEQIAPQVFCIYGHNPDGYFYKIYYPQMYYKAAEGEAWISDIAVMNGKKCIATDPKKCPLLERDQTEQ